MSSDGARFVAVSDQSHWVTGTLRYDAAGDLSGVDGETIAPLLDLEGKPLSGKNGDAEGLAFGDAADPFAHLFVSFEGSHRVWHYPFGRDGVKAVPERVALPAEAIAAPLNAGIEGLTRLDDGRLLALSERYGDTKGNYRAWALPIDAAPPAGGTAKSSGSARRVLLRPVPPFAITDARLLPGGDLLTLERSFDRVSGVGMQMRRISAATLAAALGPDPSPPLDGEVVANLDAGYEIDNMEGLSVRTGPRGETLVYAISDDNFQSTLQSTLLILFELKN